MTLCFCAHSSGTCTHSLLIYTLSTPVCAPGTPICAEFIALAPKGSRKDIDACAWGITKVCARLPGALSLALAPGPATAC
jgi:hypothetical protein